MTTKELETLVQTVTDGFNHINRRLDAILEAMQAETETLESLSERVRDLENDYNPGYSIEDYGA